MMQEKNDLDYRINSRYLNMSKGQKRIADFILDNYDEAVFLTAAELGEKAGVSESTVVRFASFLNYRGYPQLQASMEEFVRMRLSRSQTTEIRMERKGEQELYAAAFDTDMENLKHTLETVSRQNFRTAVEMIDSAERVFIIGMGECSFIADYLYLQLQKMFSYVVVLNHTDAGTMVRQLVDINEHDVVIAISLPEYSLSTLKAIEYANDSFARIISVTDSIHSPMNLYSACNLIVSAKLTDWMPSLTAVMALAQALVIALKRKREMEWDRTTRKIKTIMNDYLLTAEIESGFTE